MCCSERTHDFAVIHPNLKNDSLMSLIGLFVDIMHSKLESITRNFRVMFTPFCYVAFLTLLTALILSDYFNFNSFSDLKFHSDLPLFNQFVSALSILNHQTSIDMPRQILTLPAKANETATLIFLHGLG